MQRKHPGFVVATGRLGHRLEGTGGAIGFRNVKGLLAETSIQRITFMHIAYLAFFTSVGFAFATTLAWTGDKPP